MIRSIVLSILCIAYMGALYSMEDQQENVTIQVSGESFTVKKKVIEQSEIIKNLLEQNIPIHLKKYDPKALSIIIDILNKITDNGQKEGLTPEGVRQEVKEIMKEIQETQKLTSSTYYNIFYAVHYLKIPILYETILNITAAKIIHMDYLFTKKDLLDLLAAAVIQENTLLKEWLCKNPLRISFYSEGIGVFSKDLKKCFVPRQKKIDIFDIEASLISGNQEVIKEISYKETYVPSNVRQIVLSWDEKKIAAGGKNQILVTDTDNTLNTKYMKLKESNLDYHFRLLAFSPDSTRIVSGAKKQGTIFFWNIDEGSYIEKNFDTTGVTSLAYSPRGKTIACGFKSNMIVIWNIEEDTTTELKVADGVSSLVYLENDKLVSGSDNGKIIIWDSIEKKIYKEFNKHSSSVLSLAVSSDKKKIMSGDKEGHVYFWNIENDNTLFNFSGPYRYEEVPVVALSHDNKMFAALGENIYIWSTDFTLNEVQIFGWALQGKEISEYDIQLLSPYAKRVYDAIKQSSDKEKEEGKKRKKQQEKEEKEQEIEREIERLKLLLQEEQQNEQQQLEERQRQELQTLIEEQKKIIEKRQQHETQKLEQEQKEHLEKENREQIERMKKKHEQEKKRLGEEQKKEVQKQKIMGTNENNQLIKSLANLVRVLHALQKALL